jgi:hypothetical protein
MIVRGGPPTPSTISPCGLTGAQRMLIGLLSAVALTIGGLVLSAAVTG